MPPTGDVELYVAAQSGGGVTATIHCDPQNNVYDVNGAALVCVNTSNAPMPVTITDTATNTPTTINVPVGTTTRTAAQLASVGIRTRSDIGQFSLRNLS